MTEGKAGKWRGAKTKLEAVKTKLEAKQEELQKEEEVEEREEGVRRNLGELIMLVVKYVETGQAEFKEAIVKKVREMGGNDKPDSKLSSE